MNAPTGALAYVNVLRAPSPVALAVLVGCALSAVYLRWSPSAPDLAAQVARAAVVRRAGNISWWTGWFGGLSMPTYSVLAPSWMAAVGVRLAGVLAVVAGAAATATLVRDTRRPRIGAVAFAAAGMADLLDGRVTFAIGLAIAAWTLVAVREQWRLRGLVLGLATYLASPLAGLFLGLLLIAVVIVVRSRARVAILVAAALLVVGLAMAVLFPGTGVMPFTVSDSIPALLCAAGVAVLCRERIVRVGAGLVLLAFPVFLIMPGAVGDNITRLSWVCAVPIVAACAPLPRRLLVGALALLAIWPVADMVEQMSATGNPSAKASFYQPLSDHLAQAQAAVGNSALGERVEVIDPDNHWASVYLSSLSLARGWDRQADNADNPIFYKQGLLNATSYHQWLNQLAVGWVALPAVPLDYASVAEAKLVGSGLSYLDLVWSSPQWRLYRVDQPAPLADGATVTAVEPGSLTLDVPSASASNVSVRVRWSPYLVTVDPVTQRTIPSCIADADGWVQLYLPGAARVELTSHFDPAHRLSASDQACIQSLAGTEPG